MAFVKRTFGKIISTATARRYLPRQGFRRQRPRTRFTKADPEAPRASAQGLQRLEHQREQGRVTVSMDQGQLWPDALPRLGWLLRGQPAWVDSSLPRKQANLLCSVAVVRPLEGVLTTLCAWFPQATTAPFLAKIRRRLRGVRIDLIYDNAPHHKGGEVEQALSRHRMEPHRLPPYSPQMYAAEPWIGWVKAVLSANPCWQEHAGLVRSFIGFVASMTKRPTEVLRRYVPAMLGFTCV